VKELIACRCVHANWLGHAENVVDVSHLAWLHGFTFPGYGGRKLDLFVGTASRTAPTT
jgi:hypothetical protein